MRCLARADRSTRTMTRIVGSLARIDVPPLLACEACEVAVTPVNELPVVRGAMRRQVLLIVVCSIVALGSQPLAAADLRVPFSPELGLQEAAHPVSERPGWRPPHKIVVRNLQFPGVEYLQAAASGVQFV